MGSWWGCKKSKIPVAFDLVWVLASLVQPNHIVNLCSGVSLICRLRASSSVLGIKGKKHPLIYRVGVSEGHAERHIEIKFFFHLFYSLFRTSLRLLKSGVEIKIERRLFHVP